MVTLQHLADNFRRFFVSSQKFLALFPFCFNSIILVQKVLEELFLVEFTNQPVLNDIFTVINKKMHDSLGDLIRNTFTDNVEV